MARLLVSALHKSSGKTVLSSGLCAALAERGHRVQAFKKGPDFIDPMWLTEASGRPCYNLDFHTMSCGAITSCLSERSADSDFVLIEGNKGLHDGVASDGSDSNAALAKLTKSPVLLIVDATGMTRSVAPMVQGFRQFDREVDVCAVLLNKVGSPRHEDKLRAALERYCDVPVVGAIGRNRALELPERHLGLIPAAESVGARALVRSFSRAVAAAVDLDKIETLARGAAPLASAPRPRGAISPSRLRVGIAQCEAFTFYYPDDLEHLRRAGAELVPFDPIRSPSLPDVSALFIGGGFPECHAAALEANHRLRAEVRARANAGMPIYAECGGLMYLARSLAAGGCAFEMVGAIDGRVKMHARPQGRGYVVLARSATHPWQAHDGGEDSATIAAHEFHHSSIDDLGPQTRFAYKIIRGHGVDGQHDGIVQGNVLAAYSHRRDVDGRGWTAEFTAFVESCRQASGVMPVEVAECSR